MYIYPYSIEEYEDFWIGYMNRSQEGDSKYFSDKEISEAISNHLEDMYS